MNEKIKPWILPAVLLVILLALWYPNREDNTRINNFAAQLYDHDQPAYTGIIAKDVARDLNGVTTAAILMQTDMSCEELKEFYSDKEYKPVEEGQTVTLEVCELTEKQQKSVEKSMLYVEGANYKYLYLISK